TPGNPSQWPAYGTSPEPVPATAPAPPKIASVPATPSRNPGYPLGAEIRNAPPVYRYDGKTFQTWRDTWKHELSTEKRIEAVKALAAFGRAGYAKEAAETILDVAGEYDLSKPAPSNSEEYILRTTILK